MSEVKLIVADSSDIMLNGILSYLSACPDIIICGKATTYKSLCEEVEKKNHDVILLGPMMIDRYNDFINSSFQRKFPKKTIIQIGLSDEPADIIKKIRNHTNSSIPAKSLLKQFSNN
ncbi:MAG: hypothetical protein R6U11_07565 [Bacteroidales bacterium]